MNLTPSIRQARFPAIGKSSWQIGLPTEPEFCQLPTGCQLESRRINRLRQLAVGKVQLAKNLCQLAYFHGKSRSSVGRSSWRELSYPYGIGVDTPVLRRVSTPARHPSWDSRIRSYRCSEEVSR